MEITVVEALLMILNFIKFKHSFEDTFHKFNEMLYG